MTKQVCPSFKRDKECFDFEPNKQVNELESSIQNACEQSHL